MWSTPRDSSRDLGEEELKQLEAMFAARPATATGSSGGSAVTKPDGAPKKVAIIEFKRSYNVSIALAQFKGFSSYQQIFRALYHVRDIYRPPSSPAVV